MGKSIGKIFKAAFLPVTATVAAVKGAEKAGKALGITGKSSSSSGASVSGIANDLAQERDENAKKRVRLYATEHGELGEEVNSVGISGNRGKIFS